MSQHTDTREADVLERLKKEARDRWGDNWTIKTNTWADGSQQHRAVHSRGRVADGEFVEKDELEIGPDGTLVHQRKRIRPATVAERELLEKE